ncbi:MAG: PAS-domain containing protein [Rhodospirillales bacterium]|nr:PAS-domain containing protein [Rhodospirillales bacterium]
MSKELLLNMFYAAPELWYTLLALLIALLGIIGFLYYTIVGLRNKNYFVKRNEDRYAETMNACKDGYYMFVYPDDRINDQQPAVEYCSRRLAVVLDLPNGINSVLADVLRLFYKDDAEKIRKYIALLREDGVSFEDKFMLKSGKSLNLSGARVSGVDGSIYGDIIWFRDVSEENFYFNKLVEEQTRLKDKLIRLEDLVDNLPYPVWLRNASLNLELVNKKYVEFVDVADKNAVVAGNIEIDNGSDDSQIRQLASSAQNDNRPHSCNISRNRGGKRFCFEAIETPFHSEESLDKIATVGALYNISELDELKHNIKENQNANLEILGTLGTAFAVFNNNFKLSFYNQAFKTLWRLDEEWLNTGITYGNFLDNLRERRLLPEVPDYPYFKSEEQKMFGTIIEPKEDLLHLPDGRSLRRVRAQYLKGGMVFAFEDISDRLAASREYNSLMSVQQEILNNIEEAVLIFGGNGRLRLYNQAYVELWNVKPEDLDNEPTFNDLIEMQKSFFSDVADWRSLKKDIVKHLFSSNTKTFSLRRSSGDMVECFSTLLSNESIMVLMRKLPLA